MNRIELTPDALLPHRGSMLFIDSITKIEPASITTESIIRSDNPFLKDGWLHACALIEYMAQTVAVLQGWRNLKGGGSIRIGFLIGVDQIEFPQNMFLKSDDSITISIQEVAATGDFGSYDCTAHSGKHHLGRGLVKVFSTGGNA